MRYASIFLLNMFVYIMKYVVSITKMNKPNQDTFVCVNDLEDKDDTSKLHIFLLLHFIKYNLNTIFQKLIMKKFLLLWPPVRREGLLFITMSQS